MILIFLLLFISSYSFNTRLFLHNTIINNVIGNRVYMISNNNNNVHSSKDIVRKQLLSKSQFLASLLGAATIASSSPSYAASNVLPFPKKGYQTKSGLKYFDFDKNGNSNDNNNSPTPRYGQFVTFQYTTYYRPNLDSPLEIIDSSKEPFLQKHGNGRIVEGIEEGIHTMKVGDKRRIIVPKTLAFTKFGLGPLPLDPFKRRRLGQIIDLVDSDKGELIYDIELLNIADDDNDLGYYEDVPVTQDEVRRLVLKSLQSDNPELMEQMKSSTPKGFLKKF